VIASLDRLHAAALDAIHARPEGPALCHALTDVLRQIEAVPTRGPAADVELPLSQKARVLTLSRRLGRYAEAVAQHDAAPTHTQQREALVRLVASGLLALTAHDHYTL
jgi:hypothetical protein